MTGRKRAEHSEALEEEAIREVEAVKARNASAVHIRSITIEDERRNPFDYLAGQQPKG
jgi:hypothetical protein